jgi:hypothetical protein
MAGGDLAELAARAEQLYQDVANMGQSVHSKFVLATYNDLVTKAKAQTPDFPLETSNETEVFSLKPMCGQLRAVLAARAPARQARSSQG